MGGGVHDSPDQRADLDPLKHVVEKADDEEHGENRQDDPQRCGDARAGCLGSARGKAYRGQDEQRIDKRAHGDPDDYLLERIPEQNAEDPRRVLAGCQLHRESGYRENDGGNGDGRTGDGRKDHSSAGDGGRQNQKSIQRSTAVHPQQRGGQSGTAADDQCGYEEETLPYTVEKVANPVPHHHRLPGLEPRTF